MPRQKLKKTSRFKTARLKDSLLATRLARERIQLSMHKSARRKLVRERLDYDDPELIEARNQLARVKVDAEIARIQREITGYIRNGGEPPTRQQRESDEERRGWAMIEDILRGR